MTLRISRLKRCAEMKTIFVDTVDQVLDNVLTKGNGAAAVADGDHSGEEGVKPLATAGPQPPVPRTLN